MKKFIFSLAVVLVALSVLASAFTLSISADDATADNATEGNSETDNMDKAPVNHAYLHKVLEDFKKELLAELGQNGGFAGNVGAGYCDIALSEGQTIILSPDCEVIFRGGSAVAITTSCMEGEGLTDLSANIEIFSGEKLQFGHIYYPSGSSAKKAILVTGKTAHFTLKGNYEIV